MYYKLNALVKYDGTTQGNIDRDAFKAVCDAEVASDDVHPIVNDSYANSFYSSCSLDSNTISLTLYYNGKNSGFNSLNALWDLLDSEIDKSTVIAHSSASKGTFTMFNQGNIYSSDTVKSKD